MSPREFADAYILPGLNLLRSIDGPAVTSPAIHFLGAIALQESGQRARFQVLSTGHPGAARGFWQFEAGGGVRGVMRHARTRQAAQRLCAACLVRFEEVAIWRALEGHDVLAAGLARLLVFSDGAALPTTAGAGWKYYLRTWWPGKPHPVAWASHWAATQP